ncbi:hypothetical protein SVAN01_06651 [Stagonosporopsis vannaccii]|nr:hypothetical protein SVAN01_06651 [Stagonosporopsis vannaccii]
MEQALKARFDRVAHKRGSCNKDSTTFVRRVESAFVIGAGACVSRRVRGGRGWASSVEKRGTAVQGKRMSATLGESTVGLLQGCCYKSKARRSRRSGRDSENRAKGAYAQGRRRERGAVVEGARGDSTESHGRVMHTWGDPKSGLTGLRRSRIWGVGGVSLHSIASANSDWFARQARVLAADSDAPAASSGFDREQHDGQQSKRSCARPRCLRSSFTCRVCPSTGGALSGRSCALSLPSACTARAAARQVRSRFADPAAVARRVGQSVLNRPWLFGRQPSPNKPLPISAPAAPALPSLHLRKVEPGVAVRAPPAAHHCVFDCLHSTAIRSTHSQSSQTSCVLVVRASRAVVALLHRSSADNPRIPTLQTTLSSCSHAAAECCAAERAPAARILPVAVARQTIDFVRVHPTLARHALCSAPSFSPPW